MSAAEENGETKNLKNEQSNKDAKAMSDPEAEDMVTLLIHDVRVLKLV